MVKFLLPAEYHAVSAMLLFVYQNCLKDVHSLEEYLRVLVTHILNMTYHTFY